MMLMCMCRREYTVISAGGGQKEGKEGGEEGIGTSGRQREREDKKRHRDKGRSGGPPHFQPSVKTAECLHHREAVKEKIIAGGNRFLGSLFPAMTFTPQGEELVSRHISMRGCWVSCPITTVRINHWYSNLKSATTKKKKYIIISHQHWRH